MGEEGKKYERQRALRISQNNARMEALGVRRIANTLMGGSRGKKKSKKVVANDKVDIDYEPEGDDNDDEDSRVYTGYKADNGHVHGSQKDFETIVDPSDDEVNDENIEEVATTSQSKKKTGRGPSKPVQSSVPMVLEFDEFDLPTGVWEKSYGQQIGQCALRIDINIRKWKQVSDKQKASLWSKTKKLFHIDDPEGTRKKNFVRALGARFRHHKSDMVARFIEKKKAPKKGNPNADKTPWELYAGYITEEQWKIFADYIASDDFKKKSSIGKQCAKGNIHRHTLGQKSYSRKRADWLKEKRLPPPSESYALESSVVSERVQNRALEWCLAHQRRTCDGKWEVDPRKVETARVVGQVMEHLEKEKEDGATSTSEPDKDALSKALGKKDYYGYVKGIGRCGVGVGHRKAFGKMRRKSSISKDEEIESLKATITEMQSTQLTLMDQIASLSSSLEMFKNKQAVNSHLPQQQLAIIVASTKCRLAVKDDDGNLVVVADDTYLPSDDLVMHNSRMLPEHYRVIIEKPYDEHKLVVLQVPTADGVTTLGLAKGYYVNWPILWCYLRTWIIRRRQHQNIKKAWVVVSPLGNMSLKRASLKPHKLMGMNPPIPPQCDLLHELMVEDKHDAVCVTFKAPLLYLEKDQDVWVTSTDVIELLSLSCINVSVIHIYIRYLITEFVSSFERDYITFLCPHRFSGAECQRTFFDVVSYVKKAFICEAKKQDSHCDLILAPYNEEYDIAYLIFSRSMFFNLYMYMNVINCVLWSNHWILFAIDVRAAVIYYLDPLSLQKLDPLSCVKVFDILYKAYKARMKEEPNLVFKHVQV